MAKERIGGRMAVKTECEILYLCDGKRCEKCSEYCNHTSDISYAKNKDDFIGRKYTCLGRVSDGRLIFAEDEE